jgi:hypothetical protein
MLQKNCHPLYQCVNMNNNLFQIVVATFTHLVLNSMLKCWSSLYSSKWNLSYQVCNEYDRLQILQIIIFKAHFLGSGSSFVAKKNFPRHLSSINILRMHPLEWVDPIMSFFSPMQPFVNGGLLITLHPLFVSTYCTHGWFYMKTS